LAQINLLKQNTARPSFASFFYRLLPAVFAIVLAGLVGYYGWLFYQAHSLENQKIEIQAKMVQESQSALSNPRRNELLTRQLQTKDLSGLVAAHLYWSQIFPVLAKVTLKNASYDTITINPQSNSIQLSAQVSSLVDLDKYMQVFNYPQFNKYFSNVRIAGFSLVNGNAGESVKFSVNMNYNPNLMQYQALAGN
jgi:hypothetical protein